ncbi:conserved oligomeric Golgi complex subunit 7-like [Atheta coriaria]|uniref:conserved oligomeric Golgi complex subunit 7-like n=1 Tax=Dalotia coriaria TaxID=877792 RepID=UPI0031F37050
MDITAFSDENFDTKTWINEILKNNADMDKKENYTMSLVMKLQLYVQQVNNSLEETSHNILASMPKIIRDSKSLQQEALALKEKMEQVREEITKIEEDTGKSINSIEQLDKMKAKLMDAKQGLHESDNWTVLVNDLEEVFDSKNIPNISAKLLGMQQSLKLLVNISDYEDRKLQLEGLKNRLEAIASPSIVQALSTCDIEKSLLYARTFNSIGRLQQLLKYYHKCQKDILLKKWREQLDEQEDSVVQWIHNFFVLLISNWHAQYKWFSQVFPEENTCDCLVDLYIDVLASLDPMMNECLDAALKQTSDKLYFLLEVKQMLQQFAGSIDDVLKNIQPNISGEKSTLLRQTIYNPLVPYISKYSTYEQGHLSHKLTTINCIKEELQDTIQALGFSITPVMDIARDAHKRCKNITEYCGYCGLLIAFRTFFVTYGDQFRVALRQIDRRNEKKEDWARFQLCMSLLQNCGDVLNNLQIFEKELTNELLQPGIGDYKQLFLNGVERKEFESLVKCVTEGTRLSLLDHVLGEFGKLCADVHQTTFQVVFGPISVHLDVVQGSKTWAQFTDGGYQQELPEYSLSPQEYITQIGQYLMTLPQHLEPFLFRENPSLNCALKAADTEYANTDEEGGMADTFLKIVARGTCQTYCDRILSIHELSTPACRQLAHDISYLGSVFEDLGLTLSDNLQQLMNLLKLSPEAYQTQSAGCSPRYVAAIRQMRNITSG